MSQTVTELVIDPDTSGADQFSAAMDQAGASAESAQVSAAQMALTIAGKVGTGFPTRSCAGDSSWRSQPGRLPTPSSCRMASACSGCSIRSRPTWKAVTRASGRGPGDNVGTITQKVRMSPSDYSDTFVPWVKTTLNNGTARFTMDVWLGAALANKVCQFIKPGTGLVYQWIGPDAVDVTMTLRIYDV